MQIINGQEFYYAIASYPILDIAADLAFKINALNIENNAITGDDRGRNIAKKMAQPEGCAKPPKEDGGDYLVN